MTLQCLVVDDEPIARSILEKYISKTPNLSMAGSLDNALDALQHLSSGKVDLMFLDINMPEFTGIDLLKSMHNPPSVIITTAYADYGAESYDYEVLDYLMKPIPFERFLKAVQKAIALKNKSAPDEALTKNMPEFIFLKEDSQTHKVFIKDIRFVQAFGNYIKVFIDQQPLLVRKPLSEFAQEVTQMIRIHKSYLVTLAHIETSQGNEVVMNGGKVLPIGKLYKKEFERLTGR